MFRKTIDIWNVEIEFWDALGALLYPSAELVVIASLCKIALNDDHSALQEHNQHRLVDY